METIEKQFQKFYENIKLTSAQKQDAIDRYTGVCKKLHDYYYPNLAYDGSTKLLIGSYGKHTSIRPARDVDVIFIMPLEKFAQYDDNSSNKQSQLLQDVKRILEVKYPNTPIKAYGKIVVLEFSETKHDIELVPAWENEDGTFLIPNSENGGSWEHVGYRDEIKNISDSEAKTGKTKFLIRAVKKWSDNCSVRLRSYQIEQTVLAFFNGWDVSEIEPSILVKDFFEYFYQNTQDQSLKSHLSTAYNRAKKACDFEKDEALDDATSEWKKIFGDDFPKNTKINKSAQADFSLEALQSRYPSTKEEFLDRTYGMQFEINPVYRVTLDADVTKQNGFRNNLLSYFISHGFPLLKNNRLLFRVSHNVPSPYSIKWKVRNFGDEAASVDGGLRGEIYDDFGSETREERTLYHGEHYVECYIIKENKCVAVGRIFVPIGKNF
jgi:hypothetical protein